MSFQEHDCGIKVYTLRHSTIGFYQIEQSLAHKSGCTDLLLWPIYLTSRVIWGKLLTISVPQSLSCKMGIWKSLPHRSVLGIK